MFGNAMRRIVRTQKSGYALGLLLSLLGLVAILATLWKAWPQIYSATNPALDFWTAIWTYELVFVSGFGLKLAYLVIAGIVLIITGITVCLLSRQWLVIPGETATFQCPFCKKRWRALRDKALVHCPYCRQLVHPLMVE